MDQARDLTTPVIFANNVNFAFGEGELRKQVLFDINLSIYPGEIVLLTGPSGSGKTTLLTLIGGLRSVREGELTVLGCTVHHAKQPHLVELRRKIGYIFQAHNLLDFLSARQNVQMSLELHPELGETEIRKRAEDILREVGLENRMEYAPPKLSGGQKQRVAIARALAPSPQLVLADEPTAALDSVSGREIVNILQRLARENGSTILLVTHDNRILDIADRIIHMEDGKIIKS